MAGTDNTDSEETTLPLSRPESGGIINDNTNINFGQNNNDDHQSETTDEKKAPATEVDVAVQQPPAQSANVYFHLIADKALHFLSHASNGTIGACLVGLSATTYLVLGRVGLMLIGLVGGVALHASWDAHGETDRAAAREKELRKRREIGLEVVQRVLEWKTDRSGPDGDSDADEADVKILAKKKLDFSSFRPDTALALTTFTDAIVRDYVKWWYTPILPGEDNFPHACRQTLVAFFISLSNRLSRKRPVDGFLDFVTNSSSIVIVFLNELSAALNASPGSSAPHAVASYLQAKPDSSLANILDQRHQEKKLALVADDLLKSYLDRRAYDCLPIQIFLRQVLSKLVLAMTITTCSKPEWINGWVVHLLEDGEPGLLEAIDAGVERSANPDLKSVEKHTAVPEATMSPIEEISSAAHHKRNRSRAEEAMDEAMREAKRLTELIVQQEEAAQKKARIPSELNTSHESISEGTTEGITTPASSQSASSSRDSDTELRRSNDLSPTSLPNKQLPKPAAKSPPPTTFDQISAVRTATALNGDGDKESHLKPSPVLTLFNARISIFDDATPGDKTTLRSKPATEYMIQIEPIDSRFPGWMIVRKYADFGTLHEVLRRISNVSGLGFSEGHPNLPTWKLHTKASLRGELERYLCDAVSYQQLAESEGMKRFLEKDQGLSRSPGGTKGFGWPTPVAFDQMGKNMMDVLTKAPKDVAGGSKAFFGGVAGVLGGGKKPPGHSASASVASRSSVSLAQNYMEDSYMGSLGCDAPRQSTDSLHSLPAVQRKTSLQASAPIEARPRPSLASRGSSHGRQSVDLKRTESRTSSIMQSPHTPIEERKSLNLPPPPSEMSDDYGSPRPLSVVEQEQPPRRGEGMTYSNPASRRQSSQSLMALAEPLQGTPSRPTSSHKDRSPAPPTTRLEKPKPPIGEQETQVAVELLFAVITELYTLSSAWQIRRTLLNAAKSFLLRPGNPQLEAIRVLIQETVIEANTSDAGIAAHINTIRTSSLPTEEEKEKWPKPMDDKAKEELRAKARQLLVERGMPVALTGVMGQAATGEALGRVFDCLQDEKVARGLIFGLLLQALRGVVQ
ncbi:hypothetical protein AAFC00_001006 [Neodothiora populina]|uniref:PXA domain-containing protein n=1 Tax=Neodothiora populina TaxID=2781224 RepID=A0ABR3PMH9_9PEZI